MGKSRPWSKEQEIIVTNDDASWKALGPLILTTILWIYAFSTIFFFISPWMVWQIDSMKLLKLSFKISDNEIRQFLFIVSGYFFTIFLLMIFWRYVFISIYIYRTRKRHTRQPQGDADRKAASADYLKELKYLSQDQIQAFQKQTIIKC